MACVCCRWCPAPLWTSTLVKVPGWSEKCSTMPGTISHALSLWMRSMPSVSDAERTTGFFIFLYLLWMSYWWYICILFNWKLLSTLSATVYPSQTTNEATVSLLLGLEPAILLTPCSVVCVVTCRRPSLLWGNLCWQRDPKDSDGGKCTDQAWIL